MLKWTTLRRSCASTSSTKSTLKLAVGTVKKSMDKSSLRWFFRNAFQVGEGGLQWRTRYFSTVDFAATSMPSLRNSSTMRGEPQRALADEILRISVMTSWGTDGRPGLLRWLNFDQ